MSAVLVVHGHFYQPPREDPWLGTVPAEPSAAPYHDWNERILDECYRPFAKRGLFDRVSFDAGPTLLADLSVRAPDVVEAIVRADRESVARLGHGNALAHPPVHAILPLLSPREKRIEVRGGVRDFERRFGRRPEGMWLPECAVDDDTIAALVEAGLGFIVVAPSQVGAVRPRLGGAWSEDPEAVDPTRPFRVSSPGGARIAAFVYDGDLGGALAFGGVAASADALRDAFLARLRAASGPLVHVATDGETFGHHTRGGVEALADALAAVEASGFGISNYASVLAASPPLAELRLRSPSSWSCPHGVARWERACGCTPNPAVSQAWRAPLRRAIGDAKDAIDARFESGASPLLSDPWEALVDAPLYGEAGERSETVAVLDRRARAPLDPDARRQALRLLEMERHARLAQTSCGWFFDDLAGLEPVQILRHMARALEIGESVGLDPAVARRFEETLAEAKASTGEDGRSIYRSRARAPATTP